jgi:CheY-like chemotaxis protein
LIQDPADVPNATRYKVQTDAIVLDLALRDMDGHEVLRRLKADPATREIPVILKTTVLRDGAS